MSKSVKEALAIELTKQKISDMDPLLNDTKSAYLWYKTYEQSLKEIYEAEQKYCMEINDQKSSIFD
ncbi:hypothetical protein [Acinetobacter wuhouensis]|uniref:Uncharacterized protein n=1 Tax=Acinetobacter wuhouensis TaxID=1879050 RepID=A0A4Q7AIN8_9GAMM|nr:hypothetical protein [Acinetobacter wuhouensis]RZG48097.1 hypothetical protein EXU28_04845 [Acinetobacter wuhouensis]